MNSLMEQTKESRELEVIERMMGVVRGVEKRVTVVESDMIQVKHQLEKEVYINPAQARALGQAVKDRVRAICGDQYNEMKGKMFAALWHAVKKEFDVAQYREIPRVKIDIALKMVREWQPLNLAA